MQEVITRDPGTGLMPLEQMMKDQFANYVVQKVRCSFVLWNFASVLDLSPGWLSHLLCECSCTTWRPLSSV